MKKMFFLFFLFAVICSLSSALHETWFSAGYEQAFLMETQTDLLGYNIDKFTSSRGMNLSAYRFLHEDIGIFVHGTFLFPYESRTWDNKGIYNINLNDYLMNIQFGSTAGFAFKYDITGDFKFYGGIGLNYLMTWAVFPGEKTLSYDIFSSSIGIGGDIGLKYDFTDRIFISTGCILTFDFARHTTADTYTGSSISASASEWDPDFFMFNARPYISLGLNFFWKNNNGNLRLTTGKPD